MITLFSHQLWLMPYWHGWTWSYIQNQVALVFALLGFGAMVLPFLVAFSSRPGELPDADALKAFAFAALSQVPLWVQVFADEFNSYHWLSPTWWCDFCSSVEKSNLHVAAATFLFVEILGWIWVAISVIFMIKFIKKAYPQIEE